MYVLILMPFPRSLGVGWYRFCGWQDSCAIWNPAQGEGVSLNVGILETRQMIVVFQIYRSYILSKLTFIYAQSTSTHYLVFSGHVSPEAGLKARGSVVQHSRVNLAQVWRGNKSLELESRWDYLYFYLYSSPFSLPLAWPSCRSFVHDDHVVHCDHVDQVDHSVHVQTSVCHIVPSVVQNHAPVVRKLPDDPGLRNLRSPVDGLRNLHSDLHGLPGDRIG